MKPFWIGGWHHSVALQKAVNTTGAIGGSKPSYPVAGVEIVASVQKSTVGRTGAGGRVYSDTAHVIYTPEEPGAMAGVAPVATGDKFVWKGHVLIADGHAEPNGIGMDVAWICQCKESR
jgi:hypothetical protein